MNILVVTEKYHVTKIHNDGGARVVKLLSSIPSVKLKIADFSVADELNNGMTHVYPFQNECRFERRIMNKNYVSNIVEKHSKWSDLIIFIHCSMMFGINKSEFPNTRFVLLPMFTSKSYLQSGESVPRSYIKEENRILNLADKIITPSNLEKELIMNEGISKSKIVVIARGVQPNLNHLTRKVVQDEGLNCVCLGSIKPQKNPVDTVRLFNKIAEQKPNSKLTFIGPVQCETTYADLLNEIEVSKFSESIIIKPPIKPEILDERLQNFDVHISTSKCETFGRAIVETCVMGIPNIILRPFNAAAELLQHRIGAHIIENIDEFNENKWLNEFSIEARSLSLLGLNDIFSEDIERQRIISTITGNYSTVVADFDGTIYHKNSPELTTRWVQKISEFDCVIICSARDVFSLISKAEEIGLRYDKIVSYSGAVVTTNHDNHELISKMTKLPENCDGVYFNNNLIQGKMRLKSDAKVGEYRIEAYSDGKYYLPWSTTKLRGAVLAISSNPEIGKVVSFGDNVHDLPFIRYFGGELVTSD